MRRFVTTLTALVGLCAAMLTLGVFGAPAAGAYPPGTCAEISVSTTTPIVGAKIEVSGSSFHANEDVSIYIGGTVTVDGCQVTLSGGIKVGTAHTDASGNFDPQVTVPNLLGTQPLTGLGASGAADDSATLNLKISAANTGGTGGHRPPAGTGVAIAAMLVAAGLLIFGGLALVRSGRRRRSLPN